MATGEAPVPFDRAWEEQRRSIFRNVCAGAWWGTIASEPGIAGDLSQTKATARRGPSDGAYLLTGQKNFGSGSGITSYMITAAVPEGESGPEIFVLDMRDVPRDGVGGSDPDRCLGWSRHGCDPEPCDDVQRVPGHPHRVARVVPADPGKHRRAYSMLLYRGHRRDSRCGARHGPPTGHPAS